MIGVYDDRHPKSMTVQTEMREDTPMATQSPVTEKAPATHAETTEREMPSSDASGTMTDATESTAAGSQEEGMDPRDLAVVKWYKLSEKEQWEDYGTGVVYLEDVRNEPACFCVRGS